MNMGYRTAAATVLLVTTIHARPSLVGPGLPVIDGRPAVATVNDEPISLSELQLQLEGAPDMARLREGYARKLDLELLDRLITVRLVVQEAATMGLAELPEIRRQVDVTSRTILREVLTESLVNDVTPDETAVAALAKTLTR